MYERITTVLDLLDDLDPTNPNHAWLLTSFYEEVANQTDAVESLSALPPPQGLSIWTELIGRGFGVVGEVAAASLEARSSNDRARQTQFDEIGRRLQSAVLQVSARPTKPLRMKGD